MIFEDLFMYIHVLFFFLGEKDIKTLKIHRPHRPYRPKHPTPENWHANVCTPGAFFGAVIYYGGEGEFANHLG